MQLIKKIAPDLTEEMIKRYRVLKTVRLLQPCGRRLVVLSLGMTERTVRSEIERLSAQALVHISKIGMSLTEEGMEVLEGLETIFSALTGAFHSGGTVDGCPWGAEGLYCAGRQRQQRACQEGNGAACGARAF